MSTRKKVLLAVGGVIAVVALYVGISLTVFVAQHRRDPFQQNVATWGRNHHLGVVVNRMERWLHSKPPSSKAAGSLALGGDVADTGVESSTSSAPTTSSHPTSTAPGATPTAAAPTTVAVGGPPAPLRTVVSPALAGEGEWTPIADLAGKPIIWATSLRPIADYGSVVATAAIWDPTTLHAGLFNGTTTPGGGPWHNGRRVTPAAVPALVATFNGGFRLEHFKGGYITEGLTVRRLLDNQATLAIDAKGVMSVGVWGHDMTDTSKYVSIRQDLPPVVMDGKDSIALFPNTYWGDDFHQVTFTYRSAICAMNDGKLMYVSVGDVDIHLLAKTLVAMGCRTGMELDINGNWPQFDTYRGFGTPKRIPVGLDRRMSNLARYLRASDKDFIALFDPATLPEGVVR